MGIPLELWRARTGTFVQRPRLKPSKTAVRKDRETVKVARKTLTRNRKTATVDREAVDKETVAGLLWLIVLLYFCLCVSVELLDGVVHQLNVETRDPLTLQRQIRNTGTLATWNLTEDESSLFGFKEYAVHRLLLLLSGDIELNPGPGPEKKEAALGHDEPLPGPEVGRKRGDGLMSQEHKCLLDARRVELRDCINLEDGLVMAHLRASGAITRLHEAKIKAQVTNASRVETLLDLLQRGDCDTMDKFIHSLEATGQSLVVTNWLRPPTEGEGGKNRLSTADEDMMEKNRPKLMSNLKLTDEALAHLRARQVLTAAEESLIQGTTPNPVAVGKLVDLVLQKPPNCLDNFLHTFPSAAESYLRRPRTEDTYHGAFVVEELTQSLKRNTRDILNEWKTALEEGVSDQEQLLPYIKQPCIIQTKKDSKQQAKNLNLPTREGPESLEQLTVLDTIQIVENSQPGDRLVIYGDAGMGKTTLLKQLARSWVDGENEKLADKFAYVFLIPLRRVGRGSLLYIICDELGLLPTSSLEDLKKSLDLCEHRVLYLLDSYEELREDVFRSKRSGIDDLITGKIFPRSTVVLTTRPGSRLKKMEDQTTAHLQDLPEKEVKPIIQHHFDGNQDAVDKVQRSFPAMAYLQKPINLALFIFIIRQNKHQTLSYTQAELFNLVLQYIMLAFAKKKKLEEFIPQSGSYIANDDIHGDILRLFRDIAKKCFEDRKEIDVKVKSAKDRKEFLDFGLFTAGPDTRPYTVLLPHRLFLEYFAAAHLAENPDVWNALFEEIKVESERKSPRPLLANVVRSLGLENILRFVIALSPQPHLKQVCLQISSLFVLERQKIDEDCDNYRLANFDEYYSELIRDCCDESGKRLLATALVNAPVRDGRHRHGEEDRSHVLLPYLDYNQCVTFLKRIHNLDLSVIDGKSTLSCTGDNRSLGIGDKFVAALVYQNDCTIKSDKLDIRGGKGCNLDLPGSICTWVSGVRQFTLHYCTLVEGLPGYMSESEIGCRPATLQHSPPCPTNSLIERVELEYVKGLVHCDVIATQCQLKMEHCGNVRASALKTRFPRVSELELGDWTTVGHETKGELTSWLSTVQTVRKLDLAPQHEGESLSLSHLLNILAEREDLEKLWLWSYALLSDVRDTSDTVKQNNTLRELVLTSCKGDVDLGQLLEVCSRQCPQLEMVQVWCSNLVFDDKKAESVTQLQLFILLQSAIHTPAGQTLSEEEAEQLLHRLCPSARIGVLLYTEPNRSGSGIALTVLQSLV